MLRIPSIVGSIAGAELIRTKRSYGVEVIGDPWESLGPGSVRHPLRPIFRLTYTRRMKVECAHAAVAGYVTKTYLQKRYPPSSAAFSIDYSSIELSREDLRPRSSCQIGKRPTNLLLVGSLEQMYKGVDVLLRATRRLIDQGTEVQARIVGDGRCRRTLESLAASLNLKERVRFLGHAPGPSAVRLELEQADIFIMPSRTEGMPRALIEAMACGLPCIASAAGGISELLESEDLVPIGDDNKLAESISLVIQDDTRRMAMSVRNLIRAEDFLEDRLRSRRNAAYRALFEASA